MSQHPLSYFALFFCCFVSHFMLSSLFLFTVFLGNFSNLHHPPNKMEDIAVEMENFNHFGWMFLTYLFLTSEIIQSFDLFIQSKPCSQNDFIKCQSNQMTQKSFHTFNGSGLNLNATPHVNNKSQQSIRKHYDIKKILIFYDQLH